MIMAEPDDISLRLVLVGKTGSGKSATSNTILGEEMFKSKISAQAVTKNCQRASRKWKGRDLLVVDTPGLFDTKESLETTCHEISQCVLYSCPGPHAIILVLQLGRYTEEEQKTVALIKVLFGEAAMKYMIVLFTRKEELDNMSLNDFLAEADDKLKSLVKQCGNRCLAISNRVDEAEKEAQVQELVRLIEKMVRDNGGACFSDAIYKNVEKRLKRQAELLRNIYTDQREKELKTVEEEYAQKNGKTQEKEEKLQFIRRKYEEKIRNVREEAEKSIFNQIVSGIMNLIVKVWHLFQK